MLIAVSAIGCVSYSRARWEKLLGPRAAFELQCPLSALRIQPLTTEMYGTSDAPAYQGVEGCGRRAVYVATSEGYVLNCGDTKALTQAPATPPAAPSPLMRP
jgi:hypothetical protein